VFLPAEELYSLDSRAELEEDEGCTS